MTAEGPRLFVASSPLYRQSEPPRGSFVDRDGERYARIENVDAMAPFLMSVVSDSDHWMFIASNGGITAGRRNADHALFPYTTDDQVQDGQDHTGPVTVLRVGSAERAVLWEPFSQRYGGLARVTRNLLKSVYGNKVAFEEIHHDLGLTFTATWMNSERFGFVRRVSLRNDGSQSVAVDVLDGLQNLLPHGIEQRFQREYSTLGDGYKDAELEPRTGLGIFRLSSLPTDKAEPCEALAATTVWCEGLPSPLYLLCTQQVEAFRQGSQLTEERHVRGRRGAYLVNGRVTLPPAGRHAWTLVADVDQDAAKVTAQLDLLTGGAPLRAQIDADVTRGTQTLVDIVAQADGLQLTADEASCWRHFSNALFNVMRGGIPDKGYEIARDDFVTFAGTASPRLIQHHAPHLDEWPDTLPHAQLLRLTLESDDPALERLGREYLPLTFSRRHGDPSRPWNAFSIDIKDSLGRKKLAYQGNWRDIFQNWEALGYAFPGYVESMIFKFLDASTADGYNPYRVTREGFEWEVVDPKDPWSHIGYWGDHQVIYLLKLLELAERFRPGMLSGLLGRHVFTYANVPYRLRPFEEMLADPRHTIGFDATLHRKIEARLVREGADARALHNDRGTVARGTLAEKLGVLILARLFSFVPGAGIWMNTQRPEWNDANNALVGYGVSVVTLCYLRRLLAFCRELFAREGAREIDLSPEVAAAITSTIAALDRHAERSAGGISDADRYALLAELARLGDAYRERVYGPGLSAATAPVSAATFVALCESALVHVDRSIRANRRQDGLYHAYNLLKPLGPETLGVRRLQEMLEGQVAVLSSGLLTVSESLDVLDALRQSQLYRPDQKSYLLYPDRSLPAFLEKNRVPSAMIESSRLARAMLERRDVRVLTRDSHGDVHFAAEHHNARLLRSALDQITQEEPYAAMPPTEVATLIEIYERVFDHHSFTGRSGTFYKYEGLGCIYWHMVSKLLLAIQEVLRRSELEGAPAEARQRLVRHYEDVREGIGVHKAPSLYGAFPTDPYSHTPSFAGAQQPGMTGQVKEDLITRMGELGVVVEGGCISFQPGRVRRSELLSAAATFQYHAADGSAGSVSLAPGSLAFTLCQVPIIVSASEQTHLVVTLRDSTRRELPGLELDAATSARIFDRDLSVQRIEVFLPV